MEKIPDVVPGPLAPEPPRMSTIAEAARMDYLRNQNTMFLSNTRQLRIALTISVMTGEAQPETLSSLFGEFMAMAALCQPKEGQ